MNLQQPYVITISREIGSGGHTVGGILAEKLGVRYCDKDLIKSLVEKFHLTADEIEKLKGEKKNWLSELISILAPIPKADVYGEEARYIQEYTGDDIYKAESEILRALAKEGSCVIAGRSGFSVFKNHPNRLNIFITASDENRIKRVMEKQSLCRESAASLIEKIDRSRENYIKRVAKTSRYDSRNYDLVINSDDHTEEQVADIILAYIGCK